MGVCGTQDGTSMGWGWQTHPGDRKRTQGPLIMPFSPLGLISPSSALSPHPSCHLPYIPNPYTDGSPSRLTTLAVVSTLPGHLVLLCSPATSQTTG